MYIYKYEEIEPDGLFTTVYESHREIIDSYARNGWRFVAVIPKKFGGYGVVTKMDLVFEKKEE